MSIIRTFIAVLALTSGLFAAAGPVVAGTEINVSSGLTAQGSGLAAHGYDVVAYFTIGKPTIGRAKYSIGDVRAKLLERRKRFS